jgi:GTP-binding protein
MVNKTNFLGSFNTLKGLPDTKKAEFCFIGRSNVGKSSLINYLCQKNDLAKVSSTPGKTQSLNFFEINNAWILVDLPGYGYAKRSRSLREEWEKLMYQYFEFRENLVNIFVLIDSRIKPQSSDLELINWLGSKGIPFSLVFTKADRRELKQSKENIKIFEHKMLETWEELPTRFITSSEEKRGREELLDFIQGLL